MLTLLGNIALYISFAVASGFLIYDKMPAHRRPELMISVKRWIPYVWGLTFVILMINNPVNLPTTLQEWKWILNYTLYFIAKSLWFGSLLITSFLSKRPASWKPFIGWYAPFVIICMTITVITSMMMVPMESSSYIGALGMAYGQMLLIKHILFGGLILYTVVNMLWMRRQIIKDMPFDPKKRWRGEAIWSLIILVITGIISILSLPRNVEVSVYFNEPPLLFRWMFDVGIEQTISVSWASSFSGILFIGLGVILLASYLLSYRVRLKAVFSYALFLIAGVSIYSGMMLSLELNEMMPLSESTKQIILALGDAAFCH